MPIEKDYFVALKLNIREASMDVKAINRKEAISKAKKELNDYLKNAPCKFDKYGMEESLVQLETVCIKCGESDDDYDFVKTQKGLHCKPCFTGMPKKVKKDG